MASDGARPSHGVAVHIATITVLPLLTSEALALAVLAEGTGRADVGLNDVQVASPARVR